MSGENPEAAIRALIELCRDGDFYEDYDLSCETLGRAEEALVRCVRDAALFRKMREEVPDLIEDIHDEADVSARSGQYRRLHAIAAAIEGLMGLNPEGVGG